MTEQDEDRIEITLLQQNTQIALLEALCSQLTRLAKATDPKNDLELTGNEIANGWLKTVLYKHTLIRLIWNPNQNVELVMEAVDKEVLNPIREKIKGGEFS